MDNDLLSTIRALRDGTLGPDRFLDACRRWADRPEATLADLLAEPGGNGRPGPPPTIAGPGPGDSPTLPATLAADGAAATRGGPTLDWSGTGSDGPGADRPGDRDGPFDRLNDPPRPRDRYRPVRRLAVGGMGEVWLVSDEHVGREVAVKVLRAERSPDGRFVARFLEEARITGRLEHPNIVPVYELAAPGADGRQPFYAMKLVPSRTLAEAAADLHRGTSKSGPAALDLHGLVNAFVAVCNAVAFAHSRGVLHRDLKGQNIAVGEFGEVALLDWGLAKAVDAAEPAPGATWSAPDRDATVDGATLGTPQFMAPEQARGDRGAIGPLTDVFGLGAVLYQVLTGCAPYQGASTTEVLRQAIECRPEPPRQLAPATPPALEAICLRAMQREPRDRYRSAQELADDVRRWLADEPVHAYPEPWLRRLARWARRHRTLVAGAATLLVTATVALAVGLWRVEREKALTEAARLEAQEDYLGARNAYREQLFRVADAHLINSPGLDRVRLRMASDAVQFYAGLRRRRPNDIGLRRESALVLLAGANIARRQSRFDEAWGHYQEALRLLESLVAADPNDMESLLDWIVTAAHAGEMARMRGRPREAEPLLRAAFDRVATLTSGFQNSPWLRRMLGMAWDTLGLIQDDAGRPAEARRSLERSAALLTPLADARPADLVAASYLDNTSQLQAALLRESGDRAAAARVLDRALARTRALLRNHPEDNNLDQGLATLLVEQGRLLAADSAGAPAAERPFDEGIAQYGRIVRDYPGVPSFPLYLAVAHRERGRLRLALGHRDDAAADFEQSRALLQDAVAELPDVPRFRAELGRTFGDLGRLARDRGQLDQAVALLESAVAEQQRAFAQNPDSARIRDTLATDRADLDRLRDSPGR